MRTLVASPTYKRPKSIIKNVLFWLEDLKDIDWFLFVREDQVLYYEQSVKDPKRIIPINVNSFRETINAIGKYAVDNGYELIHKIDDDMSFKRLGKAKKIYCTEVYQKAHEEIKEIFAKDPTIGAMSISKPMNHIRNKDKQLTRKNKSLLGNYWILPHYVFMPKGLELYDDIYFTLKVLDDDMVTYSYSLCYEDTIQKKHEGGLASYDRVEMTLESIKTLQIDYPEIEIGCYKGNEEIPDIDIKKLFKNRYKKV
jgi:hypothetical protein